MTVVRWIRGVPTRRTIAVRVTGSDIAASMVTGKVQELNQLGDGGDLKCSPWKGRIGTLLHGLSPRLPTQSRVAPSRACRRWIWRYSLNGTIKVDTNPVSHLSRVLVGQHEDETGRISNRRSSPSWSHTHATLGLTEVDHVEWQWEVFMVRGGISSQQFGDLKESDKEC